LGFRVRRTWPGSGAAVKQEEAELEEGATSESNGEGVIFAVLADGMVVRNPGVRDSGHFRTPTAAAYQSMHSSSVGWISLCVGLICGLLDKGITMNAPAEAQ
jgi:hypothetical protein